MSKHNNELTRAQSVRCPWDVLTNCVLLKVCAVEPHAHKSNLTSYTNLFEYIYRPFHVHTHSGFHFFGGERGGDMFTPSLILYKNTVHM